MFRTKVRTITLDTRSLYLCRSILNPLRHPLYAWGLVSHKLLRWLVPFFLIGALALNLLLVGQPFYIVTLALQGVFYGAAFLGHLSHRKGKPVRVLGVPFSFCLVNAAALVGVGRFMLGRKSGRWQPVR
jgi:hypothetical protein